MTASFRGNVGKEEHCQVGLYATYASRHGYGFLDNRLFIPEKWFDLHLERRQIHPLENFRLAFGGVLGHRASALRRQNRIWGWIITMKNHRAYLSHRKRKLATSGVALYVSL